MPKSAGGNSAGPPDLAALLKGLYQRVARQLGLDPYYVSRVARGEFPSKMIEDALRRELLKIKARIDKAGSTGRGATRKKNVSAKTRKKSRKKTSKNAPNKPKNQKKFQLLTFKSPLEQKR